jgi:chromosome segregation ATPase
MQWLAAVASVLAMARTALAKARELLGGLDGWTAARPRHENVLRAWVKQSAAEQVAAAVRLGLEQASAAAAFARAQAVARWTALEELAATHSLPPTSNGLAARREALGALASRLDGHELQLGELSRRVAEWADSMAHARLDDEEVEQRLREAVEAEQRATGVAAEYDELCSTVGASVLELEQRLTDLRGAISTATARLAELQPDLGQP